MSVSSTSRHANAAVVQIQDSAGVDHATLVPPPPREFRFQYTEYQVRQGDRVDMLAQSVFGDPTDWWMIADCNPEILLLG